jgi:hypothetical protein
MSEKTLADSPHDYMFKKVLVHRIELDQEAVETILKKEFSVPASAWVEWGGMPPGDAAIKWTEEVK